MRRVIYANLYSRFLGGSADKSGQLKVGDEVVAIHGKNTEGMSHLEAWKLLKELPDGVVTLTVLPRNLQ